MSGEMNISASEHTIDGVLSGSFRMVVPEYQRQYAWTKDQWEEFWNDLLNIANGETHFLGSIVVIEQSTNLGELHRQEIVDGQQRLTTVSILLAVLRWQYEYRDKDEIVDKINEYLWETDQDARRHQKITLGVFDNDDFSTLISGDIPADEQSQIRKAADYFSGKLSDKSLEEMDQIRKQLLTAMTVVAIQCDSQESAFKLFETLNDRGLELSAIDLIKNHLFKKAQQDPEIDYGNIQDSWEDIIGPIQDQLNQPRRFFIHYLLSAPEPRLEDSITRHTLFDKFKEVVDERIPDSSISLEEYIDDMVDKSSLYLDIVNAEIDVFQSDANHKVNSILEDMSNLGYTQERTLLLGAFRELGSSKEIIRVLRLVETFIVRRRMTDSITGSEVNQLHSKLCSQVFEQDDPIEYLRNRLSDESPEDDVFETALRNRDFTLSSQTTYFLEKYEKVYYRNGGDILGLPNGEIEHIAPRKAYSAKKYSTWPDYLGVSEDRFDRFKNKIGNLTIFEERLNMEALDNPFEQKKDSYEASEFKMANALANNSKWSVELVEERTERLSKVACEIWDFDY